MLVVPIGLKEKASRKIPAKNARKNKKRFLVEIVKITRLMKTSGRFVTVPSRNNDTKKMIRSKVFISIASLQKLSVNEKNQRDFQF